jgi:hypothetical protein
VALNTRAARTMKQSCGRASRIALTALLFAEHLDLTGWTVQSTRCRSTARPDRGDGVLNPPSLDVAGDWSASSAAGAGSSMATFSPRGVWPASPNLVISRC